MAEQQSKRTEQWANDADTLWFGSSQGIGGAAMAKGTYRITRDRVGSSRASSARSRSRCPCGR
jgi:hypothetical protein